MRLRFALSCAAAAVLTLWLAAGCTLLPPTNPLDEEPPQAEPADARPPTGATEIEAQTAEVRIGLLIPPADSGDSLTTATRQGLELALKQRQQEAGGLPIVLVEGGETGALRDPATAAAAAERLISRDEVHALVSSLVFDQAAGAAIVAETAQTPFVSLTVDDHVLSEGRPYVFLTAADERQRALAAAEYARTRAAAERAVVIYDLASPVGAEAARTFAAAFSEAGGQLIRTIG
ncbi:MAG TPA: ABC transporter substrate-binding protein, partial [Bacillota bacterium]